MAKKDLTITSENNSVGSRSSKIKEHERALEVLAEAKKIPRKVIFLKQGESEFSRELNQIDDTTGMLNSKDAACYLHLSYNAFSRKQTNIKIPCIKRNRNSKYFKISDLDKFKAKFTNA